MELLAESSVRCIFRQPGFTKLHRSRQRLHASPIPHSGESYGNRRGFFDRSAAPRAALDGIKIVDLSRVLAAPYATQILSDYGADVIKIEDVGKGDDTRHWKVKGEEATWKDGIGPMSNYFAAINRNKRSMELNLKHEKGKSIFFRLIKEADVLVDNFRPGVLQRLGLDYQVLSKLNPRLIHATVSGYGPSGPYEKRAGYDMIAGADAGLLHLTGERGGPPVRPGLGLVDMCTGLYLHGAILNALFARERSGLGQKVDASLFETQVALLTNTGLAWLNLRQEAERWGTQHPSVVPYDAFKTQDLYFVCGATNDRQFAELCKILGAPELANDERFRTNGDRVANRDELYPILNDIFRTRKTDDWLVQFEGSAMPYSPINTMERVFAHPQTEARGMVREIAFDAAKSGSLKLIGKSTHGSDKVVQKLMRPGPAVKFSQNEPTIREKPPLLGEHTREVLEELGFSGEDITTLKAEGAI